MREMLVFWKKNEKEERDVRRREQKEAIDRAKVEEEKREAARQARKLEFLISQTELYSHFVGNKLKSTWTRQFATYTETDFCVAAELEGDDAAQADVPVAAHIADVEADELRDIDFDDGQSHSCLDAPLANICMQMMRRICINMPATMPKAPLPCPRSERRNSTLRPPSSARQMRPSSLRNAKLTFELTMTRRLLVALGLPLWTVSPKYTVLRYNPANSCVRCSGLR